MFEKLAQHEDVNEDTLREIWEKNNYRSLEQFNESSVEELAQLPNVDAKDVENTRVAREYYRSEEQAAANRSSRRKS